MGSFHYSIRTSQKKDTADVMVRICYSAYVDGKRRMSYAQSGIKIPLEAWSIKGHIKDKFTVKGNAANDGTPRDSAQKDLEEIRSFVNTRVNIIGEEKISSDVLQGIVNEFWDIRRQMHEEEQRAKTELANRETLAQYVKRYIKEIEEGSRLTNKNTKYRVGTIKAVKASMVQFAEFQKSTRRKLDFADIDLDFYNKYRSWLLNKGYKTNSVGKCVKDLKNILANAQEEGLHSNDEYKRKRFKVTTEEAYNIYLTMDELDAIARVDLSGMAKGYTDARDVFLVGCWLAQRVSDYNHLSADNIEVHKEEIVRNGEVVEVERVYVTLIQQKTGTRVIVPANKQLREILAKYDNKLPYIWEQKLNQYIKEIGKMAGIEQLVETSSTIGGERKMERTPKYKLIMSHTARRTGATLMYLGGMEVWDICRITGHTSVKTLRKYLKADELDVAGKMSKYNYFD